MRGRGRTVQPEPEMEQKSDKTDEAGTFPCTSSPTRRSWRRRWDLPSSSSSSGISDAEREKGPPQPERSGRLRYLEQRKIYTLLKEDLRKKNQEARSRNMKRKMSRKIMK